MPESTASARLRRAERDRAVWVLLAQGMTQWQVGQQLGLTQSAVAKTVERLDREALAALGPRLEERRVRQDQALSYLFQEILAEWERSKKPAARTHRETKSGGKREVPETIEAQDIAGQHGDARLAQALLGVLDMRNRLWGLYAPTKIAPTTPDGASEYEPLSLDERRRRVRALLALDATADGAPVGAVLLDRPNPPDTTSQEAP